MTLLVDVFPVSINLEKYPLVAYELVASNKEETGGVFASRIRKNLQIPAVWIKDEEVLVVPAETKVDSLMSVLKKLWGMKLTGFEQVQRVNRQSDIPISPLMKAKFVAIGLLGDANSWFRNALRKYDKRVKVVMSRRRPHFKGLVIDNRPAVQITVSSPMWSYDKITNLDMYDPQDPSGIIDTDARCGNTKGVITRIVGPLAEQRERLKSWNPSTYDASLLDTLPDSHPVVSLETYSGKNFHYPLEVLKLQIDMGNLHQVGLNTGEVSHLTGWLKIAPADRRKLIKDIVRMAREYLQSKTAHITVEDSYTSVSYPNNFVSPDRLDIQNRLRFDRGTALIQRDSQLLQAVRSQGIYRYGSRFQEDKIMRIAVIDAIPGKDHGSIRNKQLQRLASSLSEFDFEIQRAADPIHINQSRPIKQRAQLKAGLHELIEVDPDIILIYLPDSDQNRSDDDDISLYNTAKRECIGRGVPSQVIYASTVSEKWADDNIVMGILGKTGNIPYVLAKPIDYADVIVGLDVSRYRKRNAPGSMSFAALSRIYTNEGALIGYRTSPNTAVEGEIIPQSVLETILPESEFGGKRVIVHRDGRFVGQELDNLLQWGSTISADFLPIEITKSGVARLYEEKQNNFVAQAPKGAAFLLSDQEAYLVSTPPPSGRQGAFSTSRPLRIQNYSKLPLEQAIYSVMALTLLHYGSTRATRLPVSIHASDTIAGFLRRNITPRDQAGDVPFWL